MSARNQLSQIRATLALLVTQVEALEEDLGLGPQACDHPERARDGSVATFDDPGRWMCRRCGYVGGEKAATEG